MNFRKSSWTVHLSDAAAADFQSILLWTAEEFGSPQARIYEETLSLALSALTEGPGVLGVKARDDLSSGLFLLHVARNRRKGRHVLAFKVRGAEELEILRILHDSMDFARHLPSQKGG